MCGRAIVLNHFGLLSVGSLLVGQLDAQWCQVASPPKKAYRGLQKICPRKCTFPSMVGEIQPFTGVWPQTLVWWEIHELGYQYVVRLPESSTCFFYFYPFLVPVGVPKFAWLWKTNSMITLYCIYSYLIDHIKPYIRTYIYIHHIYLQSISYIWSYKKHHPTSSNMYHPTSDFTIPSILPKGFETTAVLHTGAAAGSAPTTSPDTATAAALIGGAGQCSTAWDAEDLTGCAKKVQFNFQDCGWS